MIIVLCKYKAYHYNFTFMIIPLYVCSSSVLDSGCSTIPGDLLCLLADPTRQKVCLFSLFVFV